MKVKVKIPFYATKTGTVKRNQEIDVSDSMAKDLIRNGLVAAVDQEPVKQKKGTKKTKA